MSLTRKRLVTAKIESAYGTAETNSATTDAILGGSFNITPLAGETVSRNIVRAYFGNTESITVAQHATVDFEVELTGGGKTLTNFDRPQFAALLQACGFQETGGSTVPWIYLPTTPSSLTDAATSVTIYFHNDNTLHILKGARGNVTFDVTVKKLPTMKFTFTGLLGIASQTTMPTPTYKDIAPVAVSTANTTPVTFFGMSTAGTTAADKLPLMETLTIDLANDVKLRTLVGGEHVVISDRKTKGNIKFEAPNLDDKDFFDVAKNLKKGDISLTHGTVAGNIVMIESATNGVTLDAPKYSTNEGYDMLDAGLIFLPTGSGNNELKLTFK